MDKTVDTLEFGNYAALKKIAESFIKRKKMSPIEIVASEQGGALKMPHGSYQIDIHKPFIDRGDHGEFIGKITEKNLNFEVRKNRTIENVSKCRKMSHYCVHSLSITFSLSLSICFLKKYKMFPIFHVHFQFNTTTNYIRLKLCSLHQFRRRRPTIL